MVWAVLFLKLVATPYLAPQAVETEIDSCRIAVLGDSLTAGYGLELDESFPSQLERALDGDGFDCTVLNAGVSGDTSYGGLSRLDWVLADKPSHVIIELGANDGLRGRPVDQLEENLDKILTRLDEQDIPALLTGMLAPRNFGKSYTDAFAAVYPRLAERHGVPLYPFFLEGVAAVPELNLPDGIHPTAEGISKIVNGIMPLVTCWLNENCSATG
ncbi:MAG: arylesterase [Geminicoccaceae bacterium]